MNYFNCESPRIFFDTYTKYYVGSNCEIIMCIILAIFILAVLKGIVLIGPRPSIRHVTDEVGKRSDAVMNRRDTISVIPFSSVTLTRVA